MKSNIAALKSRLINGVSPAMATPLLPDGYQVNTAVLPSLVDFLIEAGVKGLFVGGTTGEGILLTAQERKRLHEAAFAAAAGRVPFLAHVGANRIDTAVDLARHAADLGVDAIVAVTPYYYGLDDDELAGYYQAIAAAAPEVPLLMYDIPHMAVNSVSPALLVRLCAAIPSLAGIKTSQQDAQIVRRLISASPDYFTVLAGNESVALGLLALGAHGLISGLSTAVPEPFVALTGVMATNDIPAARKYQRLIHELLGLIPAGRRIGAIKQILAARGIPAGPPVPPRLPAEVDIWAEMRPGLQQNGLL